MVVIQQERDLGLCPVTSLGALGVCVSPLHLGRLKLGVNLNVKTLLEYSFSRCLSPSCGKNKYTF